MQVKVPGSLVVSRITTLPPGIVAEVVINEQTYAFGRWFSDGTWSAWWPVATGVRDVSIAAADDSEQEPSVLVSVVQWTPMPPGGRPAAYVPYERVFYRLSAGGIVPVDLEHQHHAATA